METIAQPQKKKNILSGIQPTKIFTIGNYIGAVKGWKKMQDEFNCAYFLADLHALTIRQDPKVLKERCLSNYALLMACGIDPEKSLLFIQSQVSTHAEAAWILQCYTQFGELSRMSQFKDKSKQHPENINSGLFTYPALQSADILLYQADLVPVGIDQKQHLELARNTAIRFNNANGNTFKVPEPYIPEQGAKIMSLQDPTKKMSKSDENTKGTVYLLDTPEVIMKKVKSAVTDSEAKVYYDENKPGVNNLLTIYSCMTGKTIKESELEFQNSLYGDFKNKVGEAIVEELRPIREKHEELLKDKSYLEQCYKNGAERAFAISSRTLDKMKKKIGLVM